MEKVALHLEHLAWMTQASPALYVSPSIIHELPHTAECAVICWRCNDSLSKFTIRHVLKGVGEFGVVAWWEVC